MSKDIQTEQEQATRSETKRVGLFARQPLSTLGKVAFWAFLLGTIAGTGGAIAIAITSGGSRDIEIFAAVSLVATILIVTGILWVQVIGSLVGVYLLYLQFVQPFVIESLTNPKGDPHGGFGHFIGNVFTISINILACVASIGAVVQDYRRGSRKTPGWFTSALGGCIGLAIGALFIGALASPVSTANATLTYTNGVPTVHLSPGSFDLQSATIAKGSKLLLVVTRPSSMFWRMEPGSRMRQCRSRNRVRRQSRTSR